LFKDLKSIVQTNFCVKTSPEDILDLEKVTCEFCKRQGKSTLCLEFHRRHRCRNLVKCRECQKTFRLVGKYSVEARKEIPDKHDNCDEVFCDVCKDYVRGFEDPRNPSHVCYVEPVSSAKPWPSLITAFDFETFPCDRDGNMCVNLAHLITQEDRNSPNSKFSGVFFTDVPMENVTLNGQEVVPGQEYTPDLSEDLKDYYPFEILKKACGCILPSEPDKIECGKKVKLKKSFLENN